MCKKLLVFAFIFPLSLSVLAKSKKESKSLEERMNVEIENVGIILERVQNTLQTGNDEQPEGLKTKEFDKFFKNSDKTTQFLYEEEKLDSIFGTDQKNPEKNRNKTSKEVYEELKKLAKGEGKKNKNKGEKVKYSTKFYFEVGDAESLSSLVKKETTRKGAKKGKTEKRTIPVDYAVETVSGDSNSITRYKIQLIYETKETPQFDVIKITESSNDDHSGSVKSHETANAGSIKSDGSDNQTTDGIKSKSREKKQKTTQVPLGNFYENPKLVGFNVVGPIPYMERDKKTIDQKVEEYIAVWYANPSKYLNREVLSMIEPGAEILAVEGTQTEKLPEALTESFTLDGQDLIVNLNIDDERVVAPEDRYKYQFAGSGVAMKIMPTFNVAVKDNFTDCDIDVSYETEKVYKSDKDLINRYNKAKGKVKEFYSQLDTYVGAKPHERREQKEILASNFNNVKEDTVQVERIKVKRGVEVKEMEKPLVVDSYLNKLHGESISISEPKIYNPEQDVTLDNVVFEVTQEYFDGKKYRDRTKKHIHLKRNGNTDNYVITKIEVMEGSTEIEPIENL